MKMKGSYQRNLTCFGLVVVFLVTIASCILAQPIVKPIYIPLPPKPPLKPLKFTPEELEALKKIGYRVPPPKIITPIFHPMTPMTVDEAKRKVQALQIPDNILRRRVAKCYQQKNKHRNSPFILWNIQPHYLKE